MKKQGVNIRRILRNSVGEIWKSSMNTLRANIHMARYYDRGHCDDKEREPMLVFMVDDEFYTGGLTDRLKGAITAYAWCKQRGVNFRIRYIFPYNLEDYLMPANYDWRLKKGEFTRNIHQARLMYARAEHGARLRRKRLKGKQLHYRGNYDNLDYLNRTGGTDYTWSQLFGELFLPCGRLKEVVDEQRRAIGQQYISVTFRFQNLLGDFPEYKFEALPTESERLQLMQKCRAGLECLMSKYPNVSVLVTSDSERFINHISDLPRVFVTAGKRVHASNASSSDYATHLNSFVDFFMIAGAQKVFRMGTRLMYRTQFPLYAAKLNNAPFQDITL